MLSFMVIQMAHDLQNVYKHEFQIPVLAIFIILSIKCQINN
jgi:hypothetical protein